MQHYNIMCFNSIVDRHINPRDPLNLNLRKCFLEYDKNLSGTVTVDELRAVCKEMNISVDESTLQDLIQR